MQLNPSEISELIKSRIQNLAGTTEARTQGTVISVTDGICSVTFRLPASKGPNDLLTAMLPHVSVIAFNELIPSMNDIFISTVNAVNANHILES